MPAMTVADQIIERVKAMSPESQQELLRYAEHLIQHPDDDDLDAWVASAAKLGMAGWPEEDWSKEYAEWEARQRQESGGANASG